MSNCLHSSDKVPLPGFTSCVTPPLNSSSVFRSSAWSQMNLSWFSYAPYEPDISIQFKITGRTRHETEPVTCSWSSLVTQTMLGCYTCCDSCAVLRSLEVNPLRYVILSFPSPKCWYWQVRGSRQALLSGWHRPNGVSWEYSSKQKGGSVELRYPHCPWKFPRPQ